jgi:gliding motility-associated lipoprotein GldH
MRSRQFLIPQLVTGILLMGFVLTACRQIDLYEKTKPFGKHSWATADTASFTFDIKDTTVPYKLFFVMRHEDAYGYRNIWLNIKATTPDTSFVVKKEFILSDNNKWLGNAMDDIIEHRIPFNMLKLRKPGVCTFTLQQVMREDPLQHVLNAGIRVEKVQ